MTSDLIIALAQINPVVGDVDGNVRAIREARARAARAGADLVVFSELVLAGYPPEDLVLKPAFQKDLEAAAKTLARETADGGPALLLGCPWLHGGALYNAALLLDGGAIEAVRVKHHLPNYGVFDEKRVFEEGPLPEPMTCRGVKLGVMVCEDMWLADVTGHLVEEGAEILVVLNGSPFEDEKRDERRALAAARVDETGLGLVYVNQVGGQDELVFDGASFVMNGDGAIAAHTPDWVEDVMATSWRHLGDGRWVCEAGPNAPTAGRLESLYQAMIMGLRDYVTKNRFEGVVLGLSGGVDSALSAAVAVDALGPGRVHCVLMPSRITSKTSVDDATACAGLLGAATDTVPIGPIIDAFGGVLVEVFKNTQADTTEENLQARARGMVLMALSNKFGYMVLTTGNKSEMSVGYATLYGDLCGGYSVLKDAYKTTVYELVDWRNRNLPMGAQGPKGRVIPETIITKPPSAELKPGQTDQDTLPPYAELDDILHCLIEQDMAVEKIIARGHRADLVARVEHMLYVAEYKRRQSPPGVKITRRNFGRDRRYPITNGFRDAR